MNQMPKLPRQGFVFDPNERKVYVRRHRSSSATPYGPSGFGTSQDRARLGCRERTIFVLCGTLKASEIPKISFVSQPLGRLTDCNK